MAGIVLDIGTGDGSFAYKLALNNPDKLVIGIDPNHAGMKKLSLKGLRKPSKGGTPNVLYVLASIEELPQELNGLVNQIFINFPWAGLLQKLLLADKEVWANLKRVCQAGALIDMLFGYDAEREKAKILEQNLPELTPDFIDYDLVPKLSRLGLEILESKIIKSIDLKNYPSAWAKKLAQNPTRKFYYLRLKTV
jgi:16S rRNA (adenine(1408)-N(1))-methyltransferase